MMENIQDLEIKRTVERLEREKRMQYEINKGKIARPINIKKPIAQMDGRGDVYGFKILILSDEISNFDFLKIEHQSYGPVLCQVFNIIRENGNKLIGLCKIIGYRKEGILERIRLPFDMDAKIELACDRFIEDTIGLNRVGGAFLGTLENHQDLKIEMKYKDLLTRHIGILAMSGAGKSYTVGVLLEEIMKLGVPILILDPHNEYSTIKYPNDKKEDIDKLSKISLKPFGFDTIVREWSPDTSINPGAEKLNLSLTNLTPEQFVNSLPQKLSPAQQNVIFNIMYNMNNRINIDELIFNISNEESTSKWSLITMIEQLKKDKIYSGDGTPLTEIVKHNQASIISLKGVHPRIKDIVVTNLLNDLFEARKKEEVPPFLLVLEEAHNFCGEKGMKSMRSNEIIRTISGEGRKFGLGLCVISQRPAKVDKNVLSQCMTQIIMKMNNALDIQAVISSCEGLDKDSGNEIQQLMVGSCLLTGIIDIPLKVKIRPRMSKHGGESQNIMGKK